MPVYTHEFEVKTDGHDVKGEIEFNLDGKTGYKTTEPVEWDDLEEAIRFHILLKEFKAFFDCFGGIKKIKLMEK